MSVKLDKTENCFGHASIGNSVLNGCYDLNVAEKSILYLSLGRINSKTEIVSTEDFYPINLNDYCALRKVEHTLQAYLHLKDEAKRL